MAWKGGRAGAVLAVAGGLLVGALLPAAPASAQEVFVVSGQVVDTLTGRGIPAAVVRLEGHGSVLTGESGGFRFVAVERGDYDLQVEAFGYAPRSVFLQVRGDVVVSVATELVPLDIGGLIVEPREVEVRGRVRDPVRDLPLKGVEIITGGGDNTRTNGGGGFEVGGWEGLELLLRIRAFGYLPIDTVLTPTPGERHEFDLEPDPIIERMIAEQIGRIERRAGGRRAITFRPMNRDRLLRRRGMTLYDVLHTDYAHRLRVGCVVLDERPLTPSIADGILQTIPVEDVERIEFLFRGRMLRIYTRDFMRTMLGSQVELRRATDVDIVSPPLCT